MAPSRDRTIDDRSRAGGTVNDRLGRGCDLVVGAALFVSLRAFHRSDALLVDVVSPETVMLHGSTPNPYKQAASVRGWCDFQSTNQSNAGVDRDRGEIRCRVSVSLREPIFCSPCDRDLFSSGWPGYAAVSIRLRFLKSSDQSSDRIDL